MRSTHTEPRLLHGQLGAASSTPLSKLVGKYGICIFVSFNFNQQGYRAILAPELSCVFLD
jgi:hypothetical protein